jgi:hypothetical protein
MIAPELEAVAARVVDRADILDILKLCGIAPAGIMTNAEDLLAIKRYVSALQETVAVLLRTREALDHVRDEAEYAVLRHPDPVLDRALHDAAKEIPVCGLVGPDGRRCAYGQGHGCPDHSWERPRSEWDVDQ